MVHIRNLFYGILRFLRAIAIGVLSNIIVSAIVFLIIAQTVSIDSVVRESIFDIYDFADPSIQQDVDRSVGKLCTFVDRSLQSELAKGSSTEEIKQEALKTATSPEQVDLVFKVVEECFPLLSNKSAPREFLANTVTFLIGKYRDVLVKDKTQPVWKILGPLDIAVKHVYGGLAALFGILFLFYTSRPKIYLRRIATIGVLAGFSLSVLYLSSMIYGDHASINTSPLLEIVTKGLSGGPLAEGVQEEGPLDDQGDPFPLDTKFIGVTLAKIVLPKIFPKELLSIGLLAMLVGSAVLLVVRKGGMTQKVVAKGTQK